MKEMRTLTIGGATYKIVDGDVGTLDDLRTANKNSIVDAINEVSEKMDLASRLSFGIHTDGLVYIFVDDQPVGTGIELSAGGISGYVDSANNIIINNLPDGSYTVKYEMADGSTIDIGALEVGAVGPAYTNLAEPRPENTTDHTIWCSDARMSGDGLVYERDGYTCTNYFEVAQGDVIRIRGFKIERIGLYDANKTTLPSAASSISDQATNNYIHDDYVQTDDATTFTVEALTPVYARLSGWVNGTAAEVIITRNEEII